MGAESLFAVKRRKTVENTKTFENYNLLPEGLVQMAQQDSALLNSVYKELSEKLGIDTAIEIYRLFKGQQISFPVRLYDPDKTQCLIAREYDGTNIRVLAAKYGYSEKTIRRIVKAQNE